MNSLPTIPVLSDACCLLNLYASGKFEDIASTLYQLSVADYVIQKEALFIRKQKSEAEFKEIEKS